MTGRKHSWMGAWWALVAALLLAVPAAGEDKPPLPPAEIAVLDYQAVLREAAAAKDVRSQIEVYRKQYQDEIKQEESKLRAEEAALKQQRAVLSPQAYQERRHAFEQKVIAVQKKVQVRTHALDNAFNDAMDALREVMVPIVTEMTKTKKFNIVLDSSQVMVAVGRLNITDDVIKQLDRKLKTIKVPPPKG